MSVNTSLSNDRLHICINGTLGNAIHREFRAAYETSKVSKFTIDLNKASNIDSSGLGMLLLLRDFAGGDNSDIEIIHCSDYVLDIFRVTCFFRLFNIPEYNKKAANQ